MANASVSSEPGKAECRFKSGLCATKAFGVTQGEVNSDTQGMSARHCLSTVGAPI